jgi:hypothetical protein
VIEVWLWELHAETVTSKGRSPWIGPQRSRRGGFRVGLRR